MKTAIKAEDDDQVVDVSDLLKRRDQLRGKLQNLDEQASVAPPATKKPECHWDYVIKEVVGENVCIVSIV
ncbi:hypothetical protein EON64_00155 [archaeon]|nr:MAG: hypothetical protein EON64_00155 [archaeon]